MSRLMKILGFGRRVRLAEHDYGTMTLADHREVTRIQKMIALPYSPVYRSTRPEYGSRLAERNHQEAR